MVSGAINAMLCKLTSDRSRQQKQMQPCILFYLAVFLCFQRGLIFRSLGELKFLPPKHLRLDRLLPYATIFIALARSKQAGSSGISET